MLAASALSATLAGRQVLKDISFTLAAGEFVGLIGVNGAGKSTLMRALLSLTPATGTVLFQGRELAAMRPRERARHIAYLPQEREIAWPVSVETLVALGREPHRPHFSRPGIEDARTVAAAMERMDVARLAGRPATELSGGERARVLIARTLAQEAPVIMADEPTSGLDPSHQIALMRLFSELAGEGRTIIVCLHDLALAARWTTRLILLDAGAIVADGNPTDVLTRERLGTVYGIDAYFGEARGKPLIQPLDLPASSANRAE